MKGDHAETPPQEPIAAPTSVEILVKIVHKDVVLVFGHDTYSDYDEW